MSLFEIKTSFTITVTGRKSFVIGGIIIDGTVSQGMIISEIERKILGVETIDRIGATSLSLIGLILEYANEEDLKFLNDHLIIGNKIEIY
jgi:hypothetical protein